MVVCAHCGSNNTQQGFNAFQCLDCGHRTDHLGRKLPKEPQFEGENPHERRPM